MNYPKYNSEIYAPDGNICVKESSDKNDWKFREIRICECGIRYVVYND